MSNKKILAKAIGQDVFSLGEKSVADRQREVDLLNQLLSELAPIKRDLMYTCIDLPDCWGIEIFNDDQKVAEVYCAEDKSEKLTGDLQIVAASNWDEAKFLCPAAAARYICESSFLSL